MKRETYIQHTDTYKNK